MEKVGAEHPRAETGGERGARQQKSVAAEALNKPRNLRGRGVVRVVAMETDKILRSHSPTVAKVKRADETGGDDALRDFEVFAAREKLRQLWPNMRLVAEGGS